MKVGRAGEKERRHWEKNKEERRGRTQRRMMGKCKNKGERKGNKRR